MKECWNLLREEVHSRETLCRLCASCTQLLIPIFEGEGLENNLSEKINKYLPIKVAVSDGLPVQICFQCASSVISWHELVGTCVEAELKLKTMFGMQLEDIEVQLSPEDCSGNISGHEETDDGSAFSNPGNDSKGCQDQVSGTLQSQVTNQEPKDGDKERFKTDVSEDIGIRDVCLEVMEGSLAKNDIQVKALFDHCYSQDMSAFSQKNAKPHERSRPQNSVTLRPIAPRPVLPQTVTNSVHSSVIKSPSRIPKEMKNVSPNSSRVIVVLNRLGSGPNVNQKAHAIPVRLSPRKPLSINSNHAILPKPVKAQAGARVPITFVRRPPQSNSVPRSRPDVDILSRFPILKDVTISRVPTNSSKHTSLKVPLPKASVSVIRGGNFSCKLCSSKFTNEMVFKRHMYLTHNVMKHNCPFCKVVFGKKLDLNFHIRNAHRKGPVRSEIKCKFCDEIFEKVIDLKVHIRNKHTITMSRFEQALRDRKKILGVAITDKEAEMLKEFHSRVDNKDVYNCKMCKKSWTNLEKTVAHLRTHTKELLYSCETCGQRFNTRGVMIRHTQVHKNSKPFSCDYCDKSFSSKQNRDDHHRQHTKEVKTVCESCGEFLTSASMLYYHRKIHSGHNPYKCPYCEKAYSIRSLLKRHIRFHTGEKPHLCSVCGRGFKTSGQLRGHSAVHSDARPFSCEGCGATMKTKKYLNRHRAICTGVQPKPRKTATQHCD